MAVSLPILQQGLLGGVDSNTEDEPFLPLDPLGGVGCHLGRGGWIGAVSWPEGK
jgi:hypothetical protein